MKGLVIVNWTIEELEDYVRRFLKENYGVRLHIPVRLNGRLTRVLGRFRHKDGVAHALEFNKKFFENGKEDDIIGVIKHESIHYALYETARPYKDGTPYFENELVKHNAPSTKIIRYRFEKNVQVYGCGCQEREHIQLRKLRKTYICIHCKQELNYIGKEVRVV